MSRAAENWIEGALPPRVLESRPCERHQINTSNELNRNNPQTFVVIVDVEEKAVEWSLFFYSRPSFKDQTCQLSRFHRESHHFLPFLTVLWLHLCISRFLLLFKDIEKSTDLSSKILSLVTQVSSYLTINNISMPCFVFL